MAFKFEKLEVWQKSLALICNIHELTRHFPREELFILTSQIKRAADSVALNIAEGQLVKLTLNLNYSLGMLSDQQLKLFHAFILEEEGT